MYIVNIRHEFILRRMHGIVSASPPYERVSNIMNIMNLCKFTLKRRIYAVSSFLQKNRHMSFPPCSPLGNSSTDRNVSL